jgi:MFS family permease
VFNSERSRRDDVNANDRAITGLVMLAHGMVHTYELSLPILLLVWQPLYGASDFVMGLVLTAGYAPFGLGALPGGVLADAYGSRRLIIACLVGMGAAFVALAFAPSLWFITAALVVWGVAASVYHPSGLSLISKGVEDRGTAFAYHGIAGNLGIALGPLATILLLFWLGESSWRLVVVILGLPALFGAVFALRVRVNETAAVAGDGGDAHATGSVTSFAAFLRDSRVLFASSFIVVFGIVMLSGLYYRGVLTFLPQILSRFPVLSPVEFAGRTFAPERYFYVGLLMVGVFGQYAGGKLTDRIPVENGLVIAYAALAVLALVFLPGAALGFVPLLLLGAALGFFLFIVQPLYQATVAEYTPADLRGLSYGFTYLGVFGVGALGGAVAGGVLTYFDAGTLFVVLAAFAALAAGLGLYLALRR